MQADKGAQAMRTRDDQRGDTRLAGDGVRAAVGPEDLSRPIATTDRRDIKECGDPRVRYSQVMATAPGDNNSLTWRCGGDLSGDVG